MSKLKGDTIIGIRPDGSRLLNNGGKRAIERLRTNEALEKEITQLKADKQELVKVLNEMADFMPKYIDVKYWSIVGKQQDKIRAIANKHQQE